jgi:hypothetical protein
LAPSIWLAITHPMIEVPCCNGIGGNWLQVAPSRIEHTLKIS